jgi:indoleacetamide hydrolase
LHCQAHKPLQSRAADLLIHEDGKPTRCAYSANMLLSTPSLRTPSPNASSETARQRALDCAWLGAFTFIAKDTDSNKALPQVDTAQAAIKSIAKKGVLHGQHVIIKDNLDVAGMPTTAGSTALAGHVPQRSCTAVARLQEAGAVVLGKANMHELSFGITSNNAAYGPVRNPYASDRIPGGSSGGTAAAIAARLAVAGLGSDTGGSLRIPAALCGIVGFRPTTGRWPSDGVVKISDTRDTVGPMAHSAADCALLDAIVCSQPLELPALSLAGVRMGVPRPLFWEQLEPQMREAAQAVLAALSNAGVVLVECDVGIDEADCTQAGMSLAMSEALPCLSHYMGSHGLPLDAAQFAASIASADVKGIFKAALGLQDSAAAAYQQALHVQRPALQQRYAACFARHHIDALIFPTTPLAAARIGEDETVLLNGEPVSTFMAFTRNVGPASVAGLPGISLPMGCNKAGLPQGIALDGPADSDRHLLALAVAVQALLPPMPPPQLSPPETR